MKRFLCLALALVLVAPLVACCGDKALKINPPFEAVDAPPRIVPTQYGIVQQTQTVGVVQPMQVVQPVGVCAPAAQPQAAGWYYAAPQATIPYTPGYTYAAPAAGCAPGVAH